jgi:4-amino-4-deoxy-L-arabinose transferase-like glycosyltransferase
MPSDNHSAADDDHQGIPGHRSGWIVGGAWAAEQRWRIGRHMVPALKGMTVEQAMEQLRGVTTPRREDVSTRNPVGSGAGGWPEVQPFAYRPVFAMVVPLVLLLLATASRYGYIGDELYFRWCGYHLDWSYADQPPLAPLLAGAMDRWFPGAIWALRVPAIAMTGFGVVVSALIARELGGSRRAQTIAAAAYVISPFMVLFGRYLLTSSVDVPLTSLVVLLIVRWVRLRDDRLLLLAGLVTTLELQVKFMIVFFWLIAGVAVLCCGPRELLRRPLLWVGAGVAVLASVPMLDWQASNGWPQLRMTGELANAPATKMVFGGPFEYFVGIVIFCGVAGFVLLIYGLKRLLKNKQLRFLGWTFIGLAVVFFLLDWASYYSAGVFSMLWASGAVGLDQIRRRWPMWTIRAVVVASAASLVWNLPVLPLHSIGATARSARLDVLVTVGWPEMVAQIATVYHTLPPDDRRRTTIISDTYEVASAVARYGPENGLPTPHSPNRGAWYFGTPPDSATILIYLSATPDGMRPYFSDVTQAGTIDNLAGVKTAFQDMPIWLLRGQSEPWSRLWPRMGGLQFVAT